MNLSGERPRLAALLRAAEDEGALRPLDTALADYLARCAPAADDATLALAALTSSQHGQGHLLLDLDLLRAEPGRLGLDGPAGRGLAALCGDGPLAGLLDRLRSSGLVASATQAPEATAPLVLDGHALYLRRAWRDEVEVAQRLGRRLCAGALLPADADLRPALDRLFPSTPASPVLDWQKLACALAARQPVTVITGGPGTGKTTTVVKLLGLLQELALGDGAPADARPLRIALAAPTGKAAARLNESIAGAVARLAVTDAVRAAIPTQVGTVHRLLGAQGGSRRFRHDERHPLLLDVLVVDEASMLDLELMAALLRALPEQARLILLGDRDQLASVEAGSVLGDLCAGAAGGGYTTELADWLRRQTGADVTPWLAGREPARLLDQHVVMLRDSHRFAPDRGIGRLARLLQDGGAGDPGDFSAFAPEVGTLTRAQLPDGYDDYWRVLAEPPSADAGDAAWDAWADLALATFDRFRILCAVREGVDGVVGLNAACEAHQRQRGRIQGQAAWYAGRPVMVTRNDYALGLTNGDVGITLWRPDAAAPGGRRLRVVFRASAGGVAGTTGGGLRWLLPSRLPAAQTVYAMTVHKAQGSEFERAALVLPAHPLPVLTRELIYTALTRARTRVDIVSAGPAGWRLAAGRQAIRSSGLGARLQCVTPDCRTQRI